MKNNRPDLPHSPDPAQEIIDLFSSDDIYQKLGNKTPDEVKLILRLLRGDKISDIKPEQKNEELKGNNNETNSLKEIIEDDIPEQYKKGKKYTSTPKPKRKREIDEYDDIEVIKENTNENTGYESEDILYQRSNTPSSTGYDADEGRQSPFTPLSQTEYYTLHELGNDPLYHPNTTTSVTSNTTTSNTTTALHTIGGFYGHVNPQFHTPSKNSASNMADRTPSTGDSKSSGATRVGYDSDVDPNFFVGMPAWKDPNGNTVNILFSGERLKTCFGNRQESHNLSYEVFVRFCIKKVVGLKIIEVPFALFTAFSHTIPQSDVEELSSALYRVQENINALQNDKKTVRSTFSNEIREYTFTGIRSKEIEIVTGYIKLLAERYAKQPALCHLNISSKGRDEGVKIFRAIASLKLIDEFHDLKKRLDSTNDDDKISFAKQCLATSGRLVNGMLNIFRSLDNRYTSIDPIRESFGLPNSVTIDHTGFNMGLFNRLFDCIDNASQNPSLIADLIETCFDFPMRQYPIIQKNGKAVSIRQSRKSNPVNLELESLEKVATMAMIMTFGAFPSANIDGVIPAFIGYVSERQGWNLSDGQKNQLVDSIQQDLNRAISDEDIVLNSAKIKRKSEINTVSMGIENIINNSAPVDIEDIINNNPTKRKRVTQDIVGENGGDTSGPKEHKHPYMTRSRTSNSFNR